MLVIMQERLSVNSSNELMLKMLCIRHKMKHCIVSNNYRQVVNYERFRSSLSLEEAAMYSGSEIIHLYLLSTFTVAMKCSPQSDINSEQLSQISSTFHLF